MDISHSAFPSLPFLLHGFDGAFPSSEESTPADSPKFYKHGEPSRLAGMKPVSHLSPNDTYKVWDNYFRGKEIDLSYSTCQDSEQNSGILEDVEMEFDAMPYVSPSTRRPHDAATQWPMGDKIASSSNSDIGARSSLFCSQPSQTLAGVDWCESPLGDDFYGPVSTLTSAASFEGFDLQDGSSPLGSQPHNYSNSSPSLYRFPASMQPVSVLSPITIPSPSSSPSLDSTSSYSSSVSTSLPSCPPTPPTPVLLPELRQPRPARPIPIIPLSNLATACEKAYVPSPKSSSGFPKSRRSFCESESSDLLSSLFTKPGTRYPLFPLGQISHDTLRFQSTEGKPNSTYPYINSWSGHSR